MIREKLLENLPYDLPYILKQVVLIVTFSYIYTVFDTVFNEATITIDCYDSIFNYYLSLEQFILAHV